MLLFINSLAHFCADGLCASVLFSLDDPSAWLFMLYTTLAFSLQCFIGLAADRLNKQCLLAAFSMTLIAAGGMLPLTPAFRVFLIGVGNSAFHVAGGIMTMRRSCGKARTLGIFVAPGSLGLAIGMFAPCLDIYFAAALLLCSVTVIWAETVSPSPGQDGKTPQIVAPSLLIPVLLSLAVAVRAACGGMTAVFPWKNGTALFLITVLCVAAGKAAGGFACDRIGVKKTAVISLVPAAMLAVFFCEWTIPTMAGQFALNLSMPVTLWLLYRCMPDAPGFAFGLAAAALWPGTLAGRLMHMTGPTLGSCVAACFAFGLWAILHAAHAIDKCYRLR